MDANHLFPLQSQPIVIDNVRVERPWVARSRLRAFRRKQGSGSVKAGFAGADHPKSFFPSYVGRPKHLRVMAGAVEGDTFIGRKAQELRGLLRLKYPMEHGVITDFDDMEKIWSYIYSEELKTLSEEVRIRRTAIRHHAEADPSVLNSIQCY